MSRFPTVTIELLRGGPPHNQLVSPITEYLALCGDAAPHTLRLPFEHRDLTDRLSALRYENDTARGEELRRGELQRLGRDIGALLGTVPSFAAELSGLRPDGDEVVHLRFVLAGNELAILPWEAAHIPPGLPGAGTPLLLHPGAPVALTREVRGASRRRFRWSRKPRILFAAARADDFPPGTVEAHLLALFQAVEPWAYSEWTRNGWRVEYPIEVLQAASIEALRARCLKQRFTHVHLLAHGAPLVEGSEARFGLYLHDSRDGSRRDVVSGERLAQALRAGCGVEGASDPVLVTLATCDSGRHGSVIEPGGSVAHELHQGGIPWVIASQLPLTVTGSVVLVEDLYAHLLRGEDPRRSLQCLRSHLAARFADRHDWASLVVYASVPGGFDEQVTSFRDLAASARRDRAYTLVDQLVLWEIAQHQLSPRGRLTAPDLVRVALSLGRSFSVKEAHLKEVEKAREALKDADQALKDQPEADQRSAHAALLKRVAEMQWLHPRPGDDWASTLEQALEQYRKGSTVATRSDHWSIGQVLVLETVLDHLRAKLGLAREPKDAGSQPFWAFACSAALSHVESRSAEARMWARSTLADLYMVAIAREQSIDLGAQDGGEPPTPESLVGLLTAMAQEGEAAIWPTFRQFWRYATWWKHERWQPAAEAGFARLLELVDQRLAKRALDAGPAESSSDDAFRLGGAL